MNNIKKALYTKLKELKGVTVYQIRPEVIKSFPTIVFYISGNFPVYELESNIGYQDIDITLDIWTNNSEASGSLLAEVEELLRGEGYRLVGSNDVPDPDGKSRITTLFKLLI